MNLIILGPQASGKGTQAELLSEKFSLVHVEMSHLLRNFAKQESPLDKKIESEIHQGELISDEIIQKVIVDHLQKIKKNDGLVFDGFPRRLSQAINFESYLAEQGGKIDLAIYLLLDREEILRRLSGRRTCEKCQASYNLITKPPKTSDVCDECGGKLITRDDETPEAIENRLSIFEQQTTQVINHYSQKGILEKVEGNRPIEIIFADIVGRLEKRGLINRG